MTPARIEELARQACSSDPLSIDGDFVLEPGELARFAEAVRAEALEAAISVVYSQCGSDNVAQRTVDAIRDLAEKVTKGTAE